MGDHSASLSDCVFGLVDDGVWSIFGVCDNDSLLRSNSDNDQGEKADKHVDDEQGLHG